MSETAVQLPEKKKWKKSSIRKGIALAVLISAVAVLAGVSFGIMFWIAVITLIIFEIYGRVTGNVETSAQSYEEIHAGFLGHDLNGYPDLRSRD